MGVEIDRATSESAAKSERLGKAWARKKHLSEPGIVVGTILNFIVPLDLLNHVLLLRRIVVGTVAFVVGLAMVIGANRIFRDLGTNVRPSQPTPVLATKGMYTWTRNPMYVGGGIALLGIAIDCGLDWVPLLLALSGPLLHYGIILREGAIWKASLATNTGATRPRFHVIGGDSEARGKAYR